MTDKGARARLRQAQEKDLRALEVLERATFAAVPYPYFVLRQWYDVHGDNMLVLEDSGWLAGYVMFAGTPLGRTWLLALVVDERCRGRGYGRMLVAEALRAATGEGRKDLWVTVDPGNSIALKMYRSMGFRFAGEEKDYFGRGEDRIFLVYSGTESA